MFYDDEFNITKIGPSDIEDKTGAIKNSTLTYLFTLINALLVGMMQITLRIFTTDG